LISFNFKSFINSSGSKIPNGVISQGRPAQEEDLSAVQSFMNEMSSLDVETLEKAVVPASNEKAKIIFIFFN